VIASDGLSPGRAAASELEPPSQSFTARIPHAHAHSPLTLPAARALVALRRWGATPLAAQPALVFAPCCPSLVSARIRHRLAPATMLLPPRAGGSRPRTSAGVGALVAAAALTLSLLAVCAPNVRGAAHFSLPSFASP
jgi:hypothetical protein